MPPVQRPPVEKDAGELDNIAPGSLVASAFYDFSNVQIWYYDKGTNEIVELGKTADNIVLMDIDKIQIIIEGVPINVN